MGSRDTDHSAVATDETPRFPIVGLGASAGGLRALEEFFIEMPPDRDVGFVVLTHQHPGHTSILAELLGRKTQMPVIEVRSELQVLPNHVYTMVPGHGLAIENGTLYPTQLDKRHLPIDQFFRALATDQKEHAIAIVLSGTGSDGSLGIEAIKGELGMVMVQDEASAEYAGMPFNAIATEAVDYVLPANKMPAQLCAYLDARAPLATDEQEARLDNLEEVFSLIRERVGHDFSQYKQSTVGRRVERRMTVHHLASVEDYVKYLKRHPSEIDVLFKELFIGVTSFFRDPEAWKTLAESLAALLQSKPDNYVFRAWVPGCSTGEEAYSLAIILREVMDALKRTLSVQIFATDLDAESIEVARAGAYSGGITSDVSPKRLERFFVQEEDTYRVRKEIREMVVFAPQSVIADPPFTKLDLLSCRNLLIYLNASLQKRLLPVFHYALRQDGILFLGSSESIGSFVELFTPVDRKWKIFRRNEVVSGLYAAEFPRSLETGGERSFAEGDRLRRGVKPSVDRSIERMMLRDLVPPTVLIREHGDVVHVHGRTGQFLEPAQGPQGSANIFNMARPGLEISMSAAVRRAGEGEEVIQRGIRVASNGGSALVDLRVKQLTEPEPLAGLYRITFEQALPITEESHEPARSSLPPRVDELERELQYAKESHQGTVEELETANEELKSTNEELQSTNEELQSANEELETSKEEMQSLNEELQTVNAELQNKVDELSRINNDMRNLLNGTDIATVFLDNDLRIKRFTEQARRVIRLIHADVGRPIGDLVSKLRYDRLVADAREVLRTLSFKEIEVPSESGETYLLRILPYRTTENVTDGLVLTFVDVTKMKELQAEQTRLFEILENSPACLFTQDPKGRFVWGFGRFGQKSAYDLLGKNDEEIFDDESARSFKELKRLTLSNGIAQRANVRLCIDGEYHDMALYVESRQDSAGDRAGVSVIAVDITDA